MLWLLLLQLRLAPTEGDVISLWTDESIGNAKLLLRENDLSFVGNECGCLCLGGYKHGGGFGAKRFGPKRALDDFLPGTAAHLPIRAEPYRRRCSG
jgi:hypothetical protein